MARLQVGEKVAREKQVWCLLWQCGLGLRESEIACELGWQRRTVNNYLNALRDQELAYKEGRYWLADYAS